MYVFQQANGQRGIFGGRTTLIDHRFNSSSFRRLWEPAGISIMKRAFRANSYNNRYYMAGGHTGNVFIDENFRLLRQGMMAPVKVPDVTCAAGTESYPDGIICYISYWDEATGERSSLSGGKEITVGASNNRTWGSVANPLPTIIPSEDVQCIDDQVTIVGGVVTGTIDAFSVMRPGDRIAHSLAPTQPAIIRAINSPTEMIIDDATLTCGAGTIDYLPVSRATHIELWVAVEGTLPRLAGRARVGHTIYGEQTALLKLGEAFLDNFEPFPLCSMNAFYQDRQLLAGDDKHRDTLYLSELFFPERYAGLNFKTRNGDPITGIVGTRDYALVYTYTSTYVLQGYTDNDLTFRMVTPDVGAFGHVTNCIVGDVPWQFNHRGGYMYNGAHHQQMLDRKSEWRRIYESNPDSRTFGFAVHNPNDSTVQFWPRSTYYSDQEVPGAYTLAAYNEAWIADYSDQVGDPGGGVSQPNWGSDRFSEEANPIDSAHDCSAAAYLVPTDFGIGKMYYGFDDGRVRVEDPTTATLIPEAVVRTGAFDFGNPGGDVQEGKNLKRLWSYVVAENSNWVLYVRGGDEYALENVWPEGIGNYPGGTNHFVLVRPWKDSVAASQAGDSDSLYAKKVVHVHSGIERISGRRFVFQFYFPSPIEVRFIGLGGVYGPGVAYRGLVTGFDNPGLVSVK